MRCFNTHHTALANADKNLMPLILPLLNHEVETYVKAGNEMENNELSLNKFMISSRIFMNFLVFCSFLCSSLMDIECLLI